jgi:hypothetical protein
MRRQTLRMGVADVRLYLLLPYMTLVTATKAATVAFVTVAISAPTTGRGSIVLVWILHGLNLHPDHVPHTLGCRTHEDSAVVPTPRDLNFGSLLRGQYVVQRAYGQRSEVDVTMQCARLITSNDTVILR